MSFRQGLAAALLLGSTALPAWAADYYVAPLSSPQASAPDGTRDNPFGSLDSAFKSGKVKSGDRVILLSGEHGNFNPYMLGFDSPVTIMAETPKAARLAGAFINTGSGPFIIKDVSFWPDDPKTFSSQHVKPILMVRSDAKSVILESVEFRSSVDAENYMNWTSTDWTDRALVSATDIRAPGSKILNSKFVGLKYNVVVSGADALVEGNVVEGFSGDAYRILGDRNVLRKNIAFNNFKIDDHHNDGIQSWAPSNVDGSSVSGLRIEGNTFIEWRGDSSHPLRGKMQGIGLFDGYFDDLVIENNVIVSSMHHGISVYGARGAVIRNNTVVHSDGLAQSYPWIGIFSHKNGTPSKSVSIVNNLAMKFYLASGNDPGQIFDNAVVINQLNAFEAPLAYDFRPKASSGFLDVANVNYAPATDILGNTRPSGAGPDLGAYEVGASGGEAVEDPVPSPTGDTIAPLDPVTEGGTSSTTGSETTDPAPTTGTTSTTETSNSGTTATTDPITDTTTTTTTPGRTAGKWSRPLRKK